MQKLGLFDLAYKRSEWLAQRQTLIAANIANANTPGFKTKDLSPFEHALNAGSSLASTHGLHLEAGTGQPRTPRSDAADDIERLHSGNNVEIEREFLKSGEVMRDYNMTAQIIKSFHRMLISSTKG